MGLALAAAVVVVVATGVSPGCARVAPRERPGPEDCLPHFPYRAGWLGGDAAYSVELPASAEQTRGRTLWLFGDSFVSPDPEKRDRRGAAFVHNSIAVSHCGERGFEIEYSWRQGAEGKPAAFLELNRADRYAWLFDGFVHEGVLYLGLLEVADSPAQDGGLGFRLEGMGLARIANPAAPPEDWQADWASLSASDLAFPGSAMVIRGPYVYLFSFMAAREGAQPRFLARLALDRVAAFPADLSPGLETLTRDGRWTPGFLPARAQLLMSDNASEMSVDYSGELDRWLAVYGSPIQSGEPAEAAAMGYSPTVYLRVADRLEGPWSERIPIYRFPELRDAQRAPGTFCYAAKSHGALAAPGRLLLTYVCNLAAQPGESGFETLQHLIRNMRLYRPRAVEIALPPLDARGCPKADPGNPQAPAGPALARWRRAMGCAEGAGRGPSPARQSPASEP